VTKETILDAIEHLVATEHDLVKLYVMIDNYNVAYNRLLEIDYILERV